MPTPYDILYLENIVVIMSTALLWFDYTLTFSSEVKRIWQRRFTGATVLFLVVRYSALFERVLSVIYRFNTTSDSDNLCAVISKVNNVLNVLYIDRSAPHVWYLCEGLEIDNAGVSVLVGPGYNLLLPIIGSLSQAASVGILIGVTLYKTYSIKRDSSPSGVRMPLSTVLIQDGTVFFAVILFCFLVAMVPKMTSGPTVCFLATLVGDVACSNVHFSAPQLDLIATTWPVFYPSITAIVHSRFILKLRGLYFSDSDSHLPSVSVRGLSQGRIGFTASNVIGNLGASVAIPRVEMEEPLRCGMGSSAAIDADADADEAPLFSKDPFRHGMTEHAGSSRVFSPRTRTVVDQA
ncbi:hypothetical protein LXA43DRAFT_1095479 [Ganoderma leucocontextum]|nr:hypothetical protein LXA43DRAFT_1095479 [Ganoderma leucocontextum]